MALYYYQTASDGNRTRSFRGKRSAHDHSQGIEFSKTIRSLWKKSFGVEPRLGHYDGYASNPEADYTLRWNGSTWDQ